MKYCFKIPEYVKSAISSLNANGFEAFLVGGSVRDLAMGNEPNDYDVTTNAKPDQIISVFSGKNKIIETGIKHGTVTVMFDDNPLEITTYRIDGQYINNRKPENVSFSDDIKQDLSRRDFTVNALIYNDSTGLIDYCGGIDDINNRIIRCIGDPTKRFNEDALRILRALRFSAKLDFDIDNETAEAIISQAHLLKKISAERIFAELSGMFSFSGNRLFDILTKYRQVISTVLNIQNYSCEYETVCRKTSLLDRTVTLRFSYFLARVSSTREKLIDILKKLKVSKSFEKQTLGVFDIYNYSNKIVDLKTAKKAASLFGVDLCKDVSTLLKQTQDNMVFEEYVDSIITKNLCVSLKQLDITGNDILNTFNNINPQDTGKVLNALLQLVIDDKIDNKNDLLLECIPSII